MPSPRLRCNAVDSAKPPAGYKPSSTQLIPSQPVPSWPECLVTKRLMQKTCTLTVALFSASPTDDVEDDAAATSSNNNFFFFIIIFGNYIHVY